MLPGKGSVEEDFETHAREVSWEKACQALHETREACVEAFTEAHEAFKKASREGGSKEWWQDKAESISKALEKATIAHCEALQALEETFPPEATTQTRPTQAQAKTG